MKKLIALMFCLAALTTVTRAEYPQQAPDKASAMQKAVAQKADQALMEKKLSVDVVMSVQTQEYENGNLKTTYVCKGIIMSVTGDVAIKKDCLPLLQKADEFERDIQLSVDMSKLGTYKAGKFAGDGFFYQTDDAQARTFVIAKDFIVYALPFKTTNSEVKKALNNVFKSQKFLSAQRVNTLLTTMPQAQVKKELLRH